MDVTLHNHSQASRDWNSQVHWRLAFKAPEQAACADPYTYGALHLPIHSVYYLTENCVG